MSSIITSILARSSFCLLLIFACVTVGCGSTDVLYTRDHAPVALPPRAGNYENPDKYRVNSSAYPSYVAKYNFVPPKPRDGTWVSKTSNVEILTTDVWRVTHRVGDHSLIFSSTYQDRQCNFLLTQGRFSGAFKSPLGGGCGADYLYDLYVSPEGTVIGWMLLNNRAPSWSKDRYTIMDPASRAGAGWPKQSLFEPVR